MMDMNGMVERCMDAMGSIMGGMLYRLESGHGRGKVVLRVAQV